jgi:hypothetical protein
MGHALSDGARCCIPAALPTREKRKSGFGVAKFSPFMVIVPPEMGRLGVARLVITGASYVITAGKDALYRPTVAKTSVPPSAPGAMLHENEVDETKAPARKLASCASHAVATMRVGRAACAACCLPEGYDRHELGGSSKMPAKVDAKNGNPRARRRRVHRDRRREGRPTLQQLPEHRGGQTRHVGSYKVRQIRRADRATNRSSC